MQVTFVTRKLNYEEWNHPLIKVVHPKDYNIFEHLLKEGKSKIKSPVSYSDWYLLAHDIETDGTDPLNGTLLLSAFCNNNEEVLVIDNYWVNNNEIFTNEVLKRCFFIAHNADFEARWGVVHNFLPGRYGCTMVNDKRLLTGETGYHFDIISVINRRLGYKMIPEWMDKDIREQFYNHNGTFTAEQILYNAGDTIRLKQLYIAQLEEAAAINQLYLHNTINSRIIIPIAKAEVTGIKHDTERWLNIAKDREEKAAAICQELDKIVLEEYRLNPGTINPLLKKKQEQELKRKEKLELRKSKLSQQIKLLEEKGKQHLKSYQTQKQQLDKLNNAFLIEQGLVNGEETKIFHAYVINWGSPKQVIEVLKQIGCPIPQKNDKATRKMKDGVGKEARTNWFVNNPDSAYYNFMKKFDDFKKIQHNIKSFGQKWVDNYVRNGRAYTSLDQAGTNTGRFSSGSKGTKNKTYYNGQQIPVKGADKVYRECFIADDGRTIITLDFSNCEGNLMIALSGDLNMKRIADMKDSHSYLGTLCWRAIYRDRYNKTTQPKWKDLSENYQMSKDTPEKEKERDVFKNSGGLFPVAYGVAAAKVAATSKIPLHEGQIMIDVIKNEVPLVIKFLDSKSAEALKTGYVLHNTRTGSRRGFTPILDEIHYKYKTSKSDIAETQFAARNSPIQGGNSDLMKESIAMIDLYSKLFKQDIRFLLTVHDEYVGDVKDEEADVLGEKIKQLMQRAAQNYLIKEISMGVDLRKAKYWKK